MTIIGFDVSKDELVGVRIDRGAKVREEYRLPNMKYEIEQFLDQTAKQYPRLLIASEATAEYHRPLALSCLARNISFRLINPLVTKQLTRVSIRKAKTDRTDAFLIAHSALNGAGTAISQAMFRALLR